MTTPAPIELAKAPSFRLDDKRALVTGAGRGIGLAAAAALAQAGAQVTLAARTAREIEAAAQAIRARGERAQAIVLDVTDIAATRAAIGEAEPFDILVNNAGINRPAYLRDRHDRGFRRHLFPQCARRLLHGPSSGAPPHRSGAPRLHHQRLLADGPCRRGEAQRLLRKQARDGRFHERRWQSSSRRTRYA